MLKASPQQNLYTNVILLPRSKNCLKGGGGEKMRIFARAKTKVVRRSAAKICFACSICYKVSPCQFSAKSDNFR